MVVQLQNKSKIRLKHGRLVSAKDIVPRKIKGQERINKEVNAPKKNNKSEVCVPEQSHSHKTITSCRGSINS